MTLLKEAELPQTDSYAATRRRRLRSWLPYVAIVGSLIALVMAITMPLWLPGLVRRIIPDRYIIAYAPEPVRSVLLDINPEKVLPTPVPGNEEMAAVLLATPDSQLVVTATPWPTIAAGDEATPIPTDSAAIAEADVPAEGETTEESAGDEDFTEQVVARPIPENMQLSGVTQVPQGYNMCGPATLTSYFSFWNADVTQNDIAGAIKPHPEDSNVRPDELAEYAQSMGYGAIVRIDGTIERLRQLIAAGYPVMIERGFDELPDDGWMGHYMLLIGYNDAEQTLTAMDSYWGTNRVHPDQSYPVDYWDYARLDSLWQDFNRAYMVVYPPSDAEQIADIIGEDMNDSTMYATALQRALAEKEQDPNDPFAWFNLGSIYNALGDYQQAAANFDVARQTGTPWRTMWYQFGPYEAYYQTGRYEDVLTLAQATTDPENYPESEEAFYYMGLVYEARGELRAARNMYNKALQYNPTYEAAQEALNDLSES